MPTFLNIDPATLHLPPPRSSGADPAKLQRQIARYATSIDGMPPLWVHADPDGRLIDDGVTRATRVAKLRPGLTVPAEVVGHLAKSCAHLPTVREKLP